MAELDIHDLQEATVWDVNDSKLGIVGQVHLDAATGRPEWISVPLGLLDSRRRIIPLAGATIRAGTPRADVHVPYSHEKIQDAPEFEVDRDLTPAQEETLRGYYGL